MGKLFRTDGIRGVVNAGLDADLAYKVGFAAAQVLAKNKKPGEKPLVTIGKDTRISRAGASTSSHASATVSTVSSAPQPPSSKHTNIRHSAFFTIFTPPKGKS